MKFYLFQHHMCEIKGQIQGASLNVLTYRLSFEVDYVSRVTTYCVITVYRIISWHKPWLDPGTVWSTPCSNGEGLGVVEGKSARDGSFSFGLFVLPWGCITTSRSSWTNSGTWFWLIGGRDCWGPRLTGLAPWLAPWFEPWLTPWFTPCPGQHTPGTNNDLKQI